MQLPTVGPFLHQHTGWWSLLLTTAMLCAVFRTRPRLVTWPLPTAAHPHQWHVRVVLREPGRGLCKSAREPAQATCTQRRPTPDPGQLTEVCRSGQEVVLSVVSYLLDVQALSTGDLEFREK